MKKVSSFQLALKIFISALLAAVIGIMVNFIFINALGSGWSTVLLQVLDFLLLFGLIYSAAWRDGYSEMNRVKVGFTTYDSTKGLKAGSLAMIPGLLVTLALAVSHFTSADWAWLYRIINMYAIGYINWIIDPDTALSAIPVWRILLTGAYWLLVPLITWCAFVLGFHRFSFMELFYFKKKKTNGSEQKKTSSKKRI
ncbi:MAG: hypothetical protein PUC59_04310 [Firmicutes bacterium]|nr:hypothetical protein [Bacillota bacterium]